MRVVRVLLLWMLAWVAVGFSPAPGAAPIPAAIVASVSQDGGSESDGEAPDAPPDEPVASVARRADPESPAPARVGHDNPLAAWELPPTAARSRVPDGPKPRPPRA